MRLAGCSVIGGIIGAILLPELPESAFEAIVPVLILLAVTLVILQPWLSRLVAKREGVPAHGGVAALVAVFACGIYGGYFGAAQGVLLMAFLGILLDEHLQRLNAVKNVLASLANGVAAVLFVAVAHIAWAAAALLAVGSIAGGALGAHYGRRLPELWLRRIVIVGGTIVAIILIID
jgi:uncharacterized protein